MSVRMRFRKDSWHFADLKTHGWTVEKMRKLNCYSPEDLAIFEAMEPVRPGDVWRIRWCRPGNEAGPIAGYAIGCPKCGHAHAWTTANNCGQAFTATYRDNVTGKDVPYKTCAHNGKASCWEWTGSAEAGTLTARPSLLSPECGFHGWLTDGELKEC